MKVVEKEKVYLEESTYQNICKYINPNFKKFPSYILNNNTKTLNDFK